MEPGDLKDGDTAMPTTLTATFDGAVLRPDQPLGLAPNTRVQVTLEVEKETSPPEARSFLRTAQALELDGPPDWSERLEEYLYEDPPRDHE